MALEARLLQKLSQNLLMTPQLQQAIKLLQLGRLEYKEAIEKELLENPALEEIREADSDNSEQQNGEIQSEEFNPSVLPGISGQVDSSDNSDNSGQEEAKFEGESKIDWEDYLENFTDSRGAASPKGTVDYDDRPSLEATLTRSESLVEHLITQLRMLDLDKEQSIIALQLIGNLDRDGYLCSSFEEIAQICKAEVDQVAEVAGVIRTLDPVGVCSRNLTECLCTQLEQQGLGDALETSIILKHLDKLERKRYDQIAKAENVSTDQVIRAVTTIQTLEPKPGRPFIDDATRYVVPDIYVYKVGNEYAVSLNDDGLPKLRVSPYYLKLLRGNAEQGDAANKTYLNERLKAATWLIRSIHQRQQTIYRVTESIVKFQRNFLDHGIEHLKPLVLKDVADDIKMHESTVSRVTTNKYVHTPQGVYELKFFFTTGIKSAGGDVSSSAIKEKIKQLIAAESEADPISDQKIVERLKQDHNIDIARRTVAKYREGLGIDSSSKRKRNF